MYSKLIKSILPFLILVVAIPINATASQQLSIGQTTTVYLNPSLPSGAWLTSAGWSTDVVGLVYFDAGTWGAGIRVDGYWPGTATLSCFYSYSYYGADGNIHVGSGNEYWTFTCKGYPVSLTPTYIQLDKGEKATLEFNISGASIGKIPAYWVCDDKNVATVYSTGDYTATVTAKAPGSCTITCYSYMGEPVTCDVKVNSFPPTGISLTPSEMEIVEGSSVNIKCTLTPSGASAKKTWSSEDSKIATVNNGKVTGIAPGYTRILVTTDNGLKAYAKVTVVEKYKNPRGPVSQSLQGNGSETSPYLICSAADLRYLADKVNGGTNYNGKYFRQVSDISINSGDYDSGQFKGQELWIPIGKENSPFCGVYDGNSHTISGIYMENVDDVYNSFKNIGLFGAISEDASILNLKLGNIFINFDNCTVGGVIGRIVAGKKLTVENCHVYYGKIKGTITGGIVGSMVGSNIISKCSNSANIIGTRAAGIVGTSGAKSTAEIRNCVNVGNISAPEKSSFASGIVAINGNVYNCCNGGIITGTSRASGIEESCSKSVRVSHCVNYGTLNSTNYDDNKYATAIFCYNNSSSLSVTLSNNYYLSEYQLTAAKYASKSNNHSLSVAEMKSSETLSRLNSDIESTDSKWVSNSDGFPILDFYKDLTAGVNDCMVDNEPSPKSFYSLSGDALVSVYSLSGGLLYIGEKDNIPSLRKGLYIIKFNNMAFKVMINDTKLSDRY